MASLKAHSLIASLIILFYQLSKKHTMLLSKSFTRGGQLALHRFRMWRQVVWMTLVLSLMVGLFSFAFILYRTSTAFERALIVPYILSSIENTLGLDTQHTLQSPMGRRVQLKSSAILQSAMVKHHMNNIQCKAWRALTNALWATALNVFLIVLYFVITGHLARRTTPERGARLVSPRVLKRRIKVEKIASDLTLDGIPLIKNKETSHILITGTTGSGKTNCFHTLLPQIRGRGDRAIIVDMTGEFTARYYDDACDVLLCPFDARTHHWNPWADCKDAHNDTLAAAIVPQTHRAILGERQ